MTGADESGDFVGYKDMQGGDRPHRQDPSVEQRTNAAGDDAYRVLHSLLGPDAHRQRRERQRQRAANPSYSDYILAQHAAYGTTSQMNPTETGETQQHRVNMPQRHQTEPLVEPFSGAFQPSAAAQAVPSHKPVQPGKATQPAKNRSGRRSENRKERKGRKSTPADPQARIVVAACASKALDGSMPLKLVVNRRFSGSLLSRVHARKMRCRIQKVSAVKSASEMLLGITVTTRSGYSFVVTGDTEITIYYLSNIAEGIPCFMVLAIIVPLDAPPEAQESQLGYTTMALIDAAKISRSQSPLEGQHPRGVSSAPCQTLIPSDTLNTFGNNSVPTLLPTTGVSISHYSQDPPTDWVQTPDDALLHTRGLTHSGLDAIEAMDSEMFPWTGSIGEHTSWQYSYGHVPYGAATGGSSSHQF